MQNTDLTYEMIEQAGARISTYLNPTPLIQDRQLGEKLNCQIFYKPEMLQCTGSFKIRGALNKILSLSKKEQKRGILCSSSGNHGKACAYIGKQMNIRVVVVLPDDTPRDKVDGILSLGGEVQFGPRLYDERWKMVQQEAEKTGAVIVHGYEDYLVMAGQGTLAIEMLEEHPDLDTIVVPVGGGGLISGVAVAAKTIKPDIKIIGVQASASAAYVESFRAGYPIEIEHHDSIADGIGCRRPGENPYPLIMKYVDEFVAVEEIHIKQATKMVAAHAKVLAEPTACVGVAAMIGGQIKPSKDEQIGMVLTSGNWDIERLGEIYENIIIE